MPPPPTRLQHQNRTTAAWLLGFVALVILLLGASVSFYQLARAPTPATASAHAPSNSTPDINHALL